jgi:phosphohistidine swiveling domain-containing protein
MEVDLMDEMVRTFNELTAEQQPYAGGKGGTLSRLYQAGYPVPDGFAILSTAFDGDKLLPDAWIQVKAYLDHMRQKDLRISFAVRSSALSEDSAYASFAGEFETVLDVHSDEMVREAIRTVRRSRHAERVQTYSQAKGMQLDHEIAVVVQKLVRADMSGVLFTAEPVKGDQNEMLGNFVFGFGDELVSGEVEAYSFTLKRPKGQYEGPSELKSFARKLFRLASYLESDLGCPQDIEWAIAGSKLYLLQSRPITTLIGYNPVTGEWNDSLTGYFLWTNSNVGEAAPDVMTPLNYSVLTSFHEEQWSSIGNYYFGGNISGRVYVNVSAMVALYGNLGLSVEKILAEAFGTIPEGLEIPPIPLAPLPLLRDAIPGIARQIPKQLKAMKGVPEYLATSSQLCQTMRQCIQETREQAELASLWRQTLKPYYFRAQWILKGAGKMYLLKHQDLRSKLISLVGEDDANSLLSNLSDETELLASLGPVVGIAKVARGEMNRTEFMERYGHRGPHECELSFPQPLEDPGWLDGQLEAYLKNPVDIDALLKKRHQAYESAWLRFAERYPRKVKSIKDKLAEAAEISRRREATRSEFVRFYGVLRAWALRAGQLTSLGNDIFFLTLEELLDLLTGNETAIAYIPTRRETYTKFTALPPYPTFILGRFNPIEWAADPNRRNDIYDAFTSFPTHFDTDTLTGFAGATGCVEGVVRRLDSFDQGDQLQPGEVLVAVTTNIGWTPLFPRAAAIVTDVGAPLSHAAIVARELGIPAVVGCIEATTRLRTGDRVRVDGGSGIVRILRNGDS